MHINFLHFGTTSHRLAPRYRRDATIDAGPSTTAAAPTVSTTPAVSSPAAVPPASAPGSATQTTAASTTAPATPASDVIEDGNWKQLRTRYDEVKSRAAILDSLGLDDTAALPQIVSTYKAIHTEASTLARELGYDDADFKAAFAAKPGEVLALLRKERAEAASAPPQKAGESTVDYEARIRDEVAKATKPYTDHINQQVSKQTLERVGTEITTSLKSSLPNAPDEVHDLVRDYVEEHLAHDDSALVAMKARGDFSAVDTAVKFVAGRLQQVFQKWVASETQRTGGRTSTPSPSASTPPSGKTSKFTLDQLIEDPSLLGDQYK